MSDQVAHQLRGRVASLIVSNEKLVARFRDVEALSPTEGWHEAPSEGGPSEIMTGDPISAMVFCTAFTSGLTVQFEVDAGRVGAITLAASQST
jgi:hypothetical protein